jgi:CCR4-NOT transcription complex subunit 2
LERRKATLTRQGRKISTQQYSLFDDQPPRPAIPSFRLPDCYNVTNVTPVETKIGNFSEDTLFYVFYANPGDVTQHLAAQELYGFLLPISL